VNPPHTPWLPRILAVALPLLVFSCAGLVLTGFRPEARDGTPRQWDKKLSERKPHVVVFGNSIAQRDVDVARLAERLDINKTRIAMLTTPLSGGSLWYAGLKNRVYTKDRKPKLILVVGDLTSMLGTTPLTEESGWLLASQLTSHEPLIADKVFDGGDMRWIKIKQHRGELRDFATKRVRDLSVGLFYGGGRPRRGRLEAKPALERVFADDQIDLTLHSRVIPIVEDDDPMTDYEAASPADSLLPDICRLAVEHGTPIVFVRVPLAPGNREDTHDLAVEREAIGILNRHGCGYLDMRALDLRDRHFWDKMHMNEEGAAVFTDALADVLADWKVRTRRTLPPAIIPVAPSTTSLSPDDDGVLWLEPGQSMTMTFDEAWEGPDGSFAVGVVGERIDGGSAAPTLHVEPNAPVALLRDDNRYRAELLGDAPLGPWSLTVTNPTDGPRMKVQGLAVGHGYGASLLIGSLVDQRGAAIRMIPTLAEGATIVPTYPDAPPTFPTPSTFGDPGRGGGWFDIGGHAFLSDAETSARLPHPRRCSPIRVTEDNRLLPTPRVPCTEVLKKGHGRQCHIESGVYFTATDGKRPVKNGRDYGLVLDPDRKCRRLWWVYPGDHFEIRPEESQLKTFRDGLAKMSLDLIPFAADSTDELAVDLTLWVGGKLHTQVTVRRQDLGDGGFVKAVDRLPPGETDVRLTVRNRSENVYALITLLSVSEAEQ
jgi:hypothetical protein